MHAEIICQILRGGYCHARRGDTLYGGVVCKVNERYRAVYCAGGTEIVYEEVRFLKRYADSRENNSEAFVRAQHLRLARNLRGKLRVRQAAAGEYGQLLAPDEGVQSVYRAYARLNKFGGIVARGGVYGRAVYVHALLGDERLAVVLGAAHAVKNPAQHIGRNGKLYAVAQKARL